jgi:hypothetical protein
MGTMILRNYTGHKLIITIPPKSLTLKSEGRARIDSDIKEMGRIEIEGLSIPLLSLQERAIVDLPEPEEGVIFIVSGIVATAAQRSDVMAPSRITREEGSGRVLECKALILPSPIYKEK